MISKQAILASASMLCIVTGFSQVRTAQQQMKAVEDGLTEVRQVVFADSIVPTHNIVDRMKFYQVPSVSIAVIKNGKLEWAKAYGHADTESRRLANTETLYQAASISKSVNALLIMKLAQNGKLSLDADIRGYLKSWTLPDNEVSKNKTITLKNLLSHTAGLSTSGFMGYSKTDTIPSINQILNGERPANSEAVKPVSPPATQFRYSGGGTLVTRKVLDDNISTNYDSLMQVVILKPVDMRNSSFSQPLHSRYKNIAFAYDSGMHMLKGGFNIYPEQAPDGLWTTATDLAKFVIAIQQSLKGIEAAILKQPTAIQMVTPVLASSEAALGMFILERGGEKYFRHSGANLGYRTHYYGSFSTGNGIVVLTNSDNGQRLIDEIVNSVANVYNWNDFYKPLMKKLVAIPDAVLESYVGEYHSENPQMRISVVKKGAMLELTARRPERLYPVGLNTFFLMSSPSDTCVFLSSGNDDVIDSFEVRQGAKVVIKALKKK